MINVLKGFVLGHPAKDGDDETDGVTWRNNGNPIAFKRVVDGKTRITVNLCGNPSGTVRKRLNTIADVYGVPDDLRFRQIKGKIHFGADRIPLNAPITILDTPTPEPRVY